MNEPFTIGRLAKAAGVPVSTVRYYERIGLLKPSGRTYSNYRYYGRRALEHLRFIRAAQSTGFALDDIAHLLEIRTGGVEPCREVRDLIETRLGDVERRLKDLARVKKVLKASLKRCHDAEAEGSCEVLAQLARVSAAE